MVCLYFHPFRSRMSSIFAWKMHRQSNTIYWTPQKPWSICREVFFIPTRRRAPGIFRCARYVPDENLLWLTSGSASTIVEFAINLLWGTFQTYMSKKFSWYVLTALRVFFVCGKYFTTSIGNFCMLQHETCFQNDIRLEKKFSLGMEFWKQGHFSFEKYMEPLFKNTKLINLNTIVF